MAEISNVLLVGSGAVGTMGAYNLESGGLASVTAVLRSNYAAVSSNGFNITSMDHASRADPSVRNTIPDVVKENLKPFDFIFVATKNIADVHPTVSEIIAPAVTPGHTTVALIQNGLNIEKPLIAAFPNNTILSGVALIGATETQPGSILHDDHDHLIIGPFDNPNIPLAVQLAAAKKFVEIYSASGKVDCELNENVGFVRWRKLLYNACYNSACTITRMDTTRMRIVKQPIDDLVRPLMLEICDISKAAGYQMPDGIVETMINVDPWSFFKPSMQQDIEKGNFIEFENIVGEPLREAEKLGVPAPTLKVVYGILKTLQWTTKENKGLVTLPQLPLTGA
ncbi:AF-toxin biosynthesis 12-1 [Hyphodiscus hymeniophilus]|uniref:2-dehydropantoate 2-reductase n=1 Tax=Hyphodiscus hymeniophilus TaxID=353542 RepID=A0A9P6VLW5_9HELO|nr:AF-toxin biosynthesis 12-1 [Hyphodiscus hymeniophilus]